MGIKTRGRWKELRGDPTPRVTRRDVDCSGPGWVETRRTGVQPH